MWGFILYISQKRLRFIYQSNKHINIIQYALIFVAIHEIILFKSMFDLLKPIIFLLFYFMTTRRHKSIFLFFFYALVQYMIDVASSDIEGTKMPAILVFWKLAHLICWQLLTNTKESRFSHAVNTANSLTNWTELYKREKPRS